MGVPPAPCEAAQDEGEVTTPRFRMAPQSASGAALSDKQDQSPKLSWEGGAQLQAPKLWWDARLAAGARGYDSLAQHLALPVCVLAGGPPVARHLGAACKAFHKAVAEAFGDIVRRFPQRLYVVGGLDSGYKAVGTAARFDPQTGLWEGLPPLGTPRAAPCAVVAAGRLYVLGGESAGRALADAQRFDPWTHGWEALTPMREGRIRAAAAFCGGHLYVMGGLDGSRPVRSVERYDPKTNQWETAPEMCKPRYACGVAVQGGRIIVFGGELANAGSAATMERYDPEEGRWELLPAARAASGRAPGAGSAVALDSTGRFAFSLGGLGLSGQALNVAEGLALEPLMAAPSGDQAAPETPGWGALPPMPTSRHLASVAAFRNGAVAVGGKGADFEASSDVDFYDPGMGRWEALPALPSPRLRAAAASGHL